GEHSRIAGHNLPNSSWKSLPGIFYSFDNGRLQSRPGTPDGFAQLLRPKRLEAPRRLCAVGLRVGFLPARRARGGSPRTLELSLQLRNLWSPIVQRPAERSAIDLRSSTFRRVCRMQICRFG